MADGFKVGLVQMSIPGTADDAVTKAMAGVRDAAKSEIGRAHV